MYDIAVVGGGPAGTKTAALLAKDHDVVILEEHPSCGSPAQCTGLITEDVVRSSGVKPDILNRLTGSRFHFPDGRIMEVRTGSVKAVLVDRTDLDTKMADRAVDAGAELICSARYDSHVVKDGTVRISSSAGGFESKVIVGADGHSSKVAMSLGNNGPKEYVRGIQYDIRKTSDTMDIIDIYVGNDVAPGFFAWAIPFDDRIRVGLCTSWEYGPPLQYLRSLLKMTGLDGCEILRTYSGKIPLGGRRKTYSDNTILVGDAAGLVKPISGGGLYPGLIAAEHAASTIHDALALGDLSSKIMRRYEKAWEGSIGKGLRAGYRLRRIYTGVSDRDFNRMCTIGSDPTFTDILKDVDVDNPYIAVKRIMMHPKAFFRAIPIAVRSIL